MSIGLYLSLFTILCSVPGAGASSYRSGDRIPLMDFLESLAVQSGYTLRVPLDIEGEVVIQKDVTIDPRHALNQWLPREGYFCYLEPDSQVLVVSENLSKQAFPLTGPQARGLFRMAVSKMDSAGLDSVSTALRSLIGLDNRDPDFTLAQNPGRRYLLLMPDRIEVFDSRFVSEQIRSFLNENRAQLVDSPPLALETRVYNLHEVHQEGLLRDVLAEFFGGGGFIENNGDGTPSILYHTDSQLLVVRQTSRQLMRIDGMLKDPRYRIPQPPNRLVRKEIRVAPEGSEKLSDISHRQLEVERMARIFEVVLQEKGPSRQSAEGRIIPDPDEGTITVIDTPENIARLDDFLEYRPRSRSVGVSEGSGGVQFRVIEVKHRAIDEMARALQHIPFIP